MTRDVAPGGSVVCAKAAATDTKTHEAARPWIVESGILPDDPFQVLDEEGVGKLIEFAITEGRKTRESLKVGICGEHGGEPRSVAFCHGIGMNYVSCSPFRVPIARLAAAHAALRKPG